MIRSLAPLAVLLLVVAPAGCSRKPPEPAPAVPGQATAASSPMIWRVGNGTEPQDIDPQTVTGVAGHARSGRDGVARLV